MHEEMGLPSSNNQIEYYKNPWEIDGLEACSKPEGHNNVFVKLTPDIYYTENHGFKKQL